MLNLPKEVTETVYISLCRYTGTPTITTYEPSDNALLGKQEITLDVPQLTEAEINQNKIASWQAQAEEIKAAASKRLEEISEQIQQLNCIEQQDRQDG